MARRRADAGETVDHRRPRYFEYVFFSSKRCLADLADPADLGRSDNGIGFRELSQELILVSLGKAAGYDKFCALSPLFHLCRIEDRLDGLFLSRFDESAGVHDDHIRLALLGGDLETRAGKYSEHLFSVHLVLGTAQAYHS